jgi:hypothetical protein
MDTFFGFFSSIFGKEIYNIPSFTDANVALISQLVPMFRDSSTGSAIAFQIASSVSFSIDFTLIKFSSIVISNVYFV